MLLAPDEREHLYERVAAGVDALDEGLCFGELFFHVALDLGVVARVHQRGVFGVDGQARQNALVELDDELALLHGKFRVGGDIGDLLAAGKAARGDRVKREYLGRSGPGFTDADAEQGGEAGKVALAEHFEPIARDLQRQRVERAALRELERQAFRQVPRADARRVEHLHGKQRLLEREERDVEFAGQLLKRAVKIAALVEAVDQKAAQAQKLVVDELHLPDLLGQVVAERFFARQKGGEVLHILHTGGGAAAPRVRLANLERFTLGGSGLAGELGLVIGGGLYVEQRV